MVAGSNPVLRFGVISTIGRALKNVSCCFVGDWCSDSTLDFDSSSRGLTPLSPAIIVKRRFTWKLPNIGNGLEITFSKLLAFKM